MENVVASREDLYFVFVLEGLKANCTVSKFIEVLLQRWVLPLRSLVFDRAFSLEHGQTKFLWLFLRLLGADDWILWWQQLLWQSVVIFLLNLLWDFSGLSDDVTNRVHSFSSFLVFNLLFVLPNVSVLGSRWNMAIRVHVERVVEGISVLLVGSSHEWVASAALTRRQSSLLARWDIVNQFEEPDWREKHLNLVDQENDNLDVSSDQEKQFDSIVNRWEAAVTVSLGILILQERGGVH